GRAVALTDRPGTDAVADLEPHDEPSSHSHVGRNTSCAAGGAGFTRIAGSGRRRFLTASAARSAGFGSTPPAKMRNLTTPAIGGDPPAPPNPLPGGGGVPPPAIAPAPTQPGPRVLLPPAFPHRPQARPGT